MGQRKAQERGIRGLVASVLASGFLPCDRVCHLPESVKLYSFLGDSVLIRQGQGQGLERSQLVDGP